MPSSGWRGIDTVVLDKTGTLTGGASAVDRRQTTERCVARTRAGASRRRSSAGRRIRSRRRSRAHTMPWRSAGRRFARSTGEGVEGEVDGERWRLGKRRFRRRAWPRQQPAAARCGARPTTSGVFLGSADGLAARRSRLSSPLRPDARAAIDALRLAGLDIIIASGDSESCGATRWRARCGVQRARARLSPTDKIAPGRRSARAAAIASS